MPKPKKRGRVTEGAHAPREQGFPSIALPLAPPLLPAEAKSVEKIPGGAGWLYEPKWDGFRCLAFRKDSQVLLQSKAGQPLGRYFPELVAALAGLPEEQFVLDGEIVIFHDEILSFDDLLLRIHPAESRIRKLSAESPATLMCFDLLVDGTGKQLTELPLTERRRYLEQFFGKLPRAGRVRLSPASPDRAQAERWMQELASTGLDGIIAKRLNEPYRSGERTAMVKIKRIRTADCVVGGFRYAEKSGGIGSLLLGLYNNEGLLDHVGFTSSFNAEQRQELMKIVGRLVAPPGFTGHAPGGPSRWSTRRSSEWQPLAPKLVCEVQYDHFSGNRFRHGTKFLRWRPEKKPEQCTFEQVKPIRQQRDSSPLQLAG
jgi:ATP-dependent DNA ligase